MVRPPRVEFAGAIYHVLTRGDGRQRLFHDEGHYRRFTRGLAEEVLRCSWHVFAYCWMPNHVHQYDELLSHWDGQLGGKEPAKAYQKFVLSGLTEPVENPLEGALSQWVIGSQAFLHRMLNLAESRQPRPAPAGRRRLKRLGQLTVDEIIEAVAAEHQVAPEEYVGFRSQAAGREMAALLCRRYTRVALAQLSQRFGLQHPDSSANLVRHAKKREAESLEYCRRLLTIEKLLRLKTENQV